MGGTRGSSARGLVRWDIHKGENFTGIGVGEERGEGEDDLEEGERR